MIEVRLASQDATATAGRPCATCGCLFVVISSVGQAIPGLPQALIKDRGTAAFNIKKHGHCYSFTVSLSHSNTSFYVYNVSLRRRSQWNTIENHLVLLGMSSTLSNVLELPWIRVPYSCQKSRQYREHNLKFIHHQQFHTVTYIINYSGHPKNNLSLLWEPYLWPPSPFGASPFGSASWLKPHGFDIQPIQPRHHPFCPPDLTHGFLENSEVITAMILPPLCVSQLALTHLGSFGVFLLEPTKSFEKDNFFLSFPTSNWCHWCQLYILPMSTTKNGPQSSSHPQENLFALANSTC